MTNKHKGEVPVCLGGANLVLKYDTNAIAELETVLDSDYVSIMESLSQERVSIKFLRAAIYAGLQHDRRFARGMTLQKIGKHITMENLGELYKAVARGLLLMQGVDLEDVEEAAGGDDQEDPTKVAEKKSLSPDP